MANEYFRGLRLPEGLAQAVLRAMQQQQESALGPAVMKAVENIGLGAIGGWREKKAAQYKEALAQRQAETELTGKKELMEQEYVGKKGIEQLKNIVTVDEAEGRELGLPPGQYPKERYKAALAVKVSAAKEEVPVTPEYREMFKESFGFDLPPEKTTISRQAERQILMGARGKEMAEYRQGLFFERPITSFKDDPTSGLTYLVTRLPDGTILRKTEWSVTKESASAIRNAMTQANQGFAILDSIEKNASELIFASGGPGQLAQMAIMKFKSMTGDEKARKFYQSRKAMLSYLARATGEKGVLTDYDVGRIESALPNDNDTIKSLKGKMQTIHDTISSAAESAKLVYLTPIDKLSPDMVQRRRALDIKEAMSDEQLKARADAYAKKHGIPIESRPSGQARGGRVEAPPGKTGSFLDKMGLKGAPKKKP